MGVEIQIWVCKTPRFDWLAKPLIVALCHNLYVFLQGNINANDKTVYYFLIIIKFNECQNTSEMQKCSCLSQQFIGDYFTGTQLFHP